MVSLAEGGDGGFVIHLLGDLEGVLGFMPIEEQVGQQGFGGGSAEEGDRFPLDLNLK
jgi:hypothetical protein